MKKAIKFRYITLITVIAFLMNVMLPFFAVYNVSKAIASDSTDETTSSIFGEKLLICTADGFKLVPLEDLQNGKEKPTPHSDFECALCYVSAQGAKDFAPVQETKFIYHRNVQYISYSFNETQISSSVLSHRFFTRGPPKIAKI